MKDPNEAATPVLSDHFMAYNDASSPNHGNDIWQNVPQPRPMALFNHEPQLQLGYYGNTPTYPDQDAEYNNSIQNVSDMDRIVLQEIACGSIPAGTQSIADVIFGVQAFAPPPILDEYSSTMNESAPLMLQAMEQDHINQTIYHNVSNRGGEVQCQPFDLCQRSAYDNANFDGEFGTICSPKIFSNPIIQPSSTIWLNSNEWSYPDFQPDIELVRGQSNFQVLNRESGHNAVPPTYPNNRIHGILDQGLSEAGGNIGYGRGNMNSSQHDPQPIRVDILAPSKQRRRRCNSNEEGEKHRHSLAAWVIMREHHLKRLVQENHTTEEMALELDMIHDFPTSAKTLGDKLRDWGPDFKKCARRRAAQALDRDKKRLTASDRVFRRKAKANRTNVDRRKTSNKSLMPCPMSGPTFKVYIHQERIFHELDSLLKGCFDKGTKGRGWAPGASSFIAPRGSLGNSKTWFRLSAQCSGIALLGDAELYDQLLHLFGVVLRLSTTAAQSCDLNMMIHFWAICKSLCYLRFPERRLFILPRVFLRHLSDQFSESLGNHPLVRFLESLIIVLRLSPEDFHTTMALACWKTIHVLTTSCGIPREHRIILTMASRCTKDWRSKFEARREFVGSCYKAVLQSTEVSRNVKPKQKINLLYEYLEAIAKARYNTEDVTEGQATQQDVVERAVALWEQSKELCLRDCTWKEYTKAFTFSTELLAKHHIGFLNEGGAPLSLRHDRDVGFQYMNEAIEILSLGDLQCRIRAFSFSRQLTLWLKTYQGRNNTQGERLQQERLRRTMILKSIPKADIALPEPQKLGSRGGKGNARMASNRAWWRRRQNMVRKQFGSYFPEQ